MVFHNRYKAVYHETSSSAYAKDQYFTRLDSAISFLQEKGNGKVIDTKDGTVVYVQSSKVTGV